MLQQRVNELKSAILNIVKDKVHVTGFMREEMLLLHLNEGSKCWSSLGLYDYQELDFSNIKSDALIIVQKDGKEINRYLYKRVYKDTIQFKDEDGKVLSLTITIRKSSYSSHYHLLTEKTSLLFDNNDDLSRFLLDKFGIDFSYKKLGGDLNEKYDSVRY
ncbi:hypothetical protein [Virgibacillus oceani]|uniref:Uncharacterized protein n=1 Tax=Virgibacillus oceani TaxID=1479511 RepID=A0A917HFJ0_9BACI|nr:hypothetical protein [Virgibacillus oceani]GGG77653.1 hypothetical protein GCM10011398_23510 [Virgibacillus oceani]